MSKKIESLKQQYPELGLSWMDILVRMDKTKTKKYLPLICKLISKKFDSHHFENISHVLESRMIDIKDSGLSHSQLTVMALSLIHYDEEMFKIIASFQEYMERGLIENKDIQTYNTEEELNIAVSTAIIKMSSKELEKQIVKVHEDEKWLILKPLTFSASAKYGAGTKWCTTSTNSKQHFVRYWKKGQLIYIINKQNGIKYGMFHSLDPHDRELSFWNAADSRIDFLELEIDDYLLPIIKQITKFTKTNKELCDKKTIDAVYDECSPRSKTEMLMNEMVAETARDMMEPIQQPLPEPIADPVLDRITFTPGAYTPEWVPLITNTDGTEVITDPIVGIHVNHIPGIDIPVVSHLNNESVEEIRQIIQRRLQEDIHTRLGEITGLNLGFNREERAE
jgi:hypothetical protein